MPSADWYQVISSGEEGTTTQIAYALFNNKGPYTRCCAAGTWSGWNNIRGGNIYITDIQLKILPGTGANISANSTTVLDLFDYSSYINAGYTILSFSVNANSDYLIIGYNLTNNKIRVSIYNTYNSLQSTNVGGRILYGKIVS